MTFHLMFVNITLVRFGLLSGHLLGKSCSLGDHMFSLYFDYLLFKLLPGLVLRSAFVFWLL